VHPRYRSILDTLVRAGASGAKQALARAIARRPHERFDDVLLALAETQDPAVARETATAIRVRPQEACVPALVNMLPWRHAREDARLALVAIGEPAFDHLCRALSDETLPAAVRRHVPRSVSRFDPTRACETLLRRFPDEHDTTVRYKLLRALGYVRSRHSTTRLEPAALQRALEGSLHEIFQYTDWCARLETLSAPENEMAARTLTLELLQHKTDRAIEHLFRLFSLQFPREDFRQIHRGFLSSNRQAWASSRELLEHLLRSPLKEAVLGALDDVPAARRLSVAGRYYRRPSADGRDALREILGCRDPHLRCLAAHHVAELGIADLEHELDTLRSKAAGAMEMSFRNALSLLASSRSERTLFGTH
jgi:HEAT repeat protein